MQVNVLAVVAIQLAGCFPRARKMPLVRSVSQRRAAAVRKSHCQAIKDPADQLFCGDPELKTQGRRAIYFEL